MKAEMTVKGVPEFQRTPIIVVTPVRIGKLEIYWWGLSQAHKWRWHRDHIDFGVFSVYGFRKNHPFWRFVAILIKPMRWLYHRRFYKPNSCDSILRGG